MTPTTTPRPTLSEIREQIGYDEDVQSHGWPRAPHRREITLRAVARAQREHADAANSLAAERAEALSVIEELENVAAALRAVIAGTATGFQVSEVRMYIAGDGTLQVGDSALNWDLLFASARPVVRS